MSGQLIDVHTHFFPPDLPAPPTPAAEQAGWPVVRESGGQRQIFQRGSLVRTLDPVAWDAEARLQDMARSGMRGHVLSPIPFTFLYDAYPGVALELARLHNDAIAKVCAADPEHFAGLGSVPLQDPGLAVAELHRVRSELGLAGLEIGTNVAGASLHEERFAPFFAAAEASDSPLLVHPCQPLAPARTAHHGLAFGLARPLETTLAVGSLLHGGVLAAHPRLRICLAHGGGCAAVLTGRWEQAWEVLDRPPAVAVESPRDQLRRFWVDTLVYDPEVLRLVAQTFGPDKLVLGTDYPFVVAERPPGRAVAAAVAARLLDWTAEGWRQALADNATTFLRGG